MFTSADAVTTEEFLRYEPGKHFLGLVNAQIQEETLDYGRKGRFCMGGLPGGLPADSTPARSARKKSIFRTTVYRQGLQVYATYGDCEKRGSGDLYDPDK